MFAQHPSLEALKPYHCDYLFQAKDNQPKVHAKMKGIFKDAALQEPDGCLEIFEDIPPQKPPKSQNCKVDKKEYREDKHVCGSDWGEAWTVYPGNGGGTCLDHRRVAKISRLSMVINHKGRTATKSENSSISTV